MSQTPEQLLVMVRGGDRDAYAALYRALNPQVHGIMRRRLAGSPDLVDEALQETWLRVWRHARRYDPSLGPALSWIAGIARNEANTQLKRRGRIAEAVEEMSIDPVHDDLPERLASLNLDDLDRQICYLAFYLDHTHAEMASSLGLPLGTVKGRMRRILKVLRNEYSNE